MLRAGRAHRIRETMDTSLLASLSFVLITIFTPGPNNISSASMGVLYGYRQTARYLAGITAGFFGLMLLCGAASTVLLQALPSYDLALRLIGAAYILYLAYHTLRASYSFAEGEHKLLGFSRGLFLQLLNPKGIVFGLTLFSTFLSSITGDPVLLLLVALVLASLAFCAVSLWALSGAFIRKTLQQPRVRQGVNLVLALLLVYTAIEISGLFA
jgi:cysteine/O-acetylserine efflux protein